MAQNRFESSERNNVDNDHDLRSIGFQLNKSISPRQLMRRTSKYQIPSNELGDIIFEEQHEDDLAVS